MSEEVKSLFIKCLLACTEEGEAEILAEKFGVSKTSLAAFKANKTMGRYN